MMVRRRTWLLLLLALALRLLLQGWDSGYSSASLHPDERQVSFVSERLEGWFDNPEFFAYGSLHFQATRATAAVFSLGESLRGLTTAGRLVSLAASMLTLILGWILAHRAWGRKTADLFLLLAAWVPLDIQQSHFSTVEAHHTVWVVVALAAAFWLAVGGRSPAAIAAGAAFGASLAVKVASLPLGLPLAIAVVLAARLRVLDTLRLAVTAAGAAVITFWLGQPWAFSGSRPPLVLLSALVAAAIVLHFANARHGAARRGLIAAGVILTGLAALQIGALFLVGTGGSVAAVLAAGAEFNPEYVRGVGEQIQMVLGESDLPYVRVYANTLPILYPLRELAMWGWGPMLLLAAIIATAAACRRQVLGWRRWLAGRWNHGSVLLLLTVAWLVPMAVRLSTLEVKYLRYWEPLVVPAVLVASWWMCRLRGPKRRLVVGTVVAGGVLWGAAYVWAFVDPHPHRTASRWLAPLVNNGQVVAFESWDETISLEITDGTIDRIHLPSYDLPDDRAKALRWAHELARADWVVLTSNRVVRTVFANPKRFEITSRLYRLLLTGEAGFEVLTSVRRGPRIFGLEWPVQAADESFVNYEFPQVLILRRVATVAPEELAERVMRPLPYLDQWGYAEIQRHVIDGVPRVPAVPSPTRQILDVILWMLVIGGLGIASWVLLLPLVKGLPDAGAGLALTSGWILPAWLLWFGGELRIWSISSVSATWVYFAISGAAVIVAHHRRSEILATIARRRTAMLKVLVIAAAVGLFFVAVRAINPAIFWGEKPMDFAFLNAFLRSPVWPPGEPWMAGMPLHYYYFGEVLAAFPILVAGCTAGVGYNLMAATIPAFGAAILASIGLSIAGRRRWFAATVLPVLVLLTGNLAWPWLLDLLHQGKVFDLWWATSRVVPGFAIDEYPLWTALFADLHGHFIALPVLLATLYWGWLTARTRGRSWIAAAGICGVGAAALVATNPWDLFLFTATLATAALVASPRPLWSLGRLAAAGAFSFVAALPFVIELIAGINAGAGGRGLFLTDADFAPAWAVLRHFGLFLIPLGVLALAVLGRRWWYVVPTAGIGIVGGLALGSSAAAMALAATALFATVTVISRVRRDRLGWALATLGSVAIAACERFTLIDRMNTMFKIYNGVWVVLALALAVVVLRSRGGQRRLVLATWLPLQIVGALNLPLGVAQAWLQPRIESPRPSLDGQAYLEAGDPQTWFLIRTLQGAARPGDVVAEAAGPGYSKHTRIAMHTGLPTVVGWEWHLTQRGQPIKEIGARFKDLETLYGGGDRLARRAVLDRYGIRWVVVADLENSRYGPQSKDSLSQVPGTVEVANRGGASLYRVEEFSRSRAPIEPIMKLPRGASIVGRLPAARRAVLRSLALDDMGALVMLQDGRLVEYDLGGMAIGEVPSPPCDAVAAQRWKGEAWTVCRDGRIFRLQGDAWRSAGSLDGAGGLTAADDLWAWGEGGVWRWEGSGWRRIRNDRVTAAAASEGRLAWSDGTTVVAVDGDAVTEVSGTLAGVSGLAWQGASLIALDSTGIHRSGGAILPWKPILTETGEISALAGRDTSLWLVRSDGHIIESVVTRCPPPWQTETSADGISLREPRDLVVSPQGWFAAVDTQNHRIRWFSSGGDCLDQFGSEGAAPGEFLEPSGLALAPDGTLAITDTWNGRIQLIHPDGTIEAFGQGLFGPRDALWSGASLLVADTGNRQILRFDPPDWRQTIVATMPGPVVGLAPAMGVVAAAVPVDGGIILFDPESGAVVRRLEIPGWHSGEQQEAYLAVLPSGELAASAPLPGELWIVDPTTDEPARLLRKNLPGITGIVLQPDGNLLGSLTWEHRLVTIPLEGSTPAP